MDHGTDIEVLQTALEWLEQNQDVTLITVVSSFGTTPRQAGALMAIHPDGKFVGSVSGGCIEDDLLQRQFKGEFSDSAAKLIEYGVNSKQAQQVGLPCGGSIKLLVEKLESLSQLSTLVKSIQSRQLIKRRVCLNTGEVSLHKIDKSASSESDFRFSTDEVSKLFGPQWRLLLIGAGELSRRVAQLAMTLDYEVVVCDPRTEYAHNWQLEGTVLKTAAPVDIVQKIVPDAKTAILALSHSPMLDDRAIAAALQTNAFYIGALGSKKNTDKLRKRLNLLGASTKHIEKLHAPVGLAIGSHTPAEIAISIIADLVKTRNSLSIANNPDLRFHG